MKELKKCLEERGEINIYKNYCNNELLLVVKKANDTETFHKPLYEVLSSMSSELLRIKMIIVEYDEGFEVLKVDEKIVQVVALLYYLRRKLDVETTPALPAPRVKGIAQKLILLWQLLRQKLLARV